MPTQLDGAVEPTARAHVPPPVQAPPALDSRARRALQWLTVAILFGAIVFGCARTLDWPAGWIALSLVVAGLFGQDIHVRRRNPGLMERRRRRRPETPWWDRLLVVYSQLCGFAIFAVAGLEGVKAHPGFVPLPMWLAGLLIWGAGQWLVAWAMATNSFFEGTIRLQEDVSHRVVSTGPYAFVRHPGYIGLLVFSLALPLLFGALPALIPALLTVGWLLPRTLIEDRFLKANLPGYAQYARKVRWRWVPGVW